MIEEINKKLDILELERIKEILPDYIHKTSKSLVKIIVHFFAFVL